MGFLAFLRLSRLLSSSAFVLTPSFHLPGFCSDATTFASLLFACGRAKSLSDWYRVHRSIVTLGLNRIPHLQRLIPCTYDQCEALEDARACFAEIHDRNAVSWNVFIRAYVCSGQGRNVLDFFNKTDQEETLSDKVTFVNVLSVCARDRALVEGQRMHAYAVHVVLDLDVFVATAIVNMYGKCGSLEDAHRMFAIMPGRDVISWNTMIAAYAHHGHGNACLQILARMYLEGVLPDKLTLVSVLSACASQAHLDKGKQVHSCIILGQSRADIIVGTALVNMYNKCHNLEDARRIFNNMPLRDMIAWNAMIAGYAQHGQADDVFRLFKEMQRQGLFPNKVTFVSLVDACTCQALLAEGKWLHSHLIKGGFESDVVLGTALVNMYSKCGCPEDAWRTFDNIPERNLVSWNAMIAGYSQHQHLEKALRVFHLMQSEGVYPDSKTYVYLLDACASPENLVEGGWIHTSVLLDGLESDISVATSIVKMYGKCCVVDDAQRTYDSFPELDVVMCDAMIMVCAEHGLINCALQIFHKMQKGGVQPDKFTFIGLLSACAFQAALSEGRWVHLSAVCHGLGTDTMVANALVKMYSKSGSLDDAQMLFEKMNKRTLTLWTTMIAAYTQSEQEMFAFALFDQMQKEGMIPDTVMFANVLDACAGQSALVEGQNIHKCIVQRGLELDVLVANSLVNMYGKCGSLDDARAAFNRLSKQNLISCNTVLVAYAQHGNLKAALKIFHRMNCDGISPDTVTFLSILSACASQAAITEGKLIHSTITYCGFESHVGVASSLIKMYTKCHDLEDAKGVFDRLLERNVVVWNAMITAYAARGYSKEAFQLWEQMWGEGMIADKVTYICLLTACVHQALLVRGKQMHVCIISSGYELDAIMATGLVSMYGRCCSLEDACAVFDNMPKRDVVFLNAMMTVFSQHGYNHKAIQVFDQMLGCGVLPNSVTLISLLDACSGCTALMKGKHIHSCIMCSAYCLDADVWNALISMYGKCHSLVRARRVFDELIEPHLVSWNAMIGAYTNSGHCKEALEMFNQMEIEGVIPDEYTFISILNSCGILHSTYQGKVIHSSIMYNEAASCVSVSNALVAMYGKCSSLHDAHTVFYEMPSRNASSWNAMISIYSQHGKVTEAIELFVQMCEGGLQDMITFVSILSACTSQANLRVGKQIHTLVTCSKVNCDVIIENILVNMYGKCGSLEDSQNIFDMIRDKNVASWNGIVTACGHNGHFIEALQLFNLMLERAVIPNKVTFVSLLDSCARLGTCAKGKLLHTYIINQGFELDVVVATALMNLYGKCGNLEDALETFNNMTERNLIAWTAMTGAYSGHGHGKDALQLVMQMQNEGFMVDEVMLVNMLSACSHSGLVKEGDYLLHMHEDHSVKAILDHYDCLIDLLGRVGKLNEAEHLINKMPFQPTAVSWTGLLGACQNLGDVERGKRAVQHISELDTKDTAPYVLSSNACSVARRGMMQGR